MFWTWLLYQNIPIDGVVEESLKADPNNRVAYGLLVSLLILGIAWQLWRNSKLHERYESLQDKYERRLESFINTMNESSRTVDVMINTVRDGDNHLQRDLSDIKHILEHLKDEMLKLVNNSNGR